MSIPPLVCSSPPPPEQCEDDKEPEDYDFQYNSQPDDDEDSTSYNYDDFSSNTLYKTEADNLQNLKISKNISDELQNISPLSEAETKTINTVPLTEDCENSDLQEDCVLEDLNLEITESLQINTHDKITTEDNILNIDSSNTTNIQDEGGTEVDIENIQNKDCKSLSQASSENEDLQVFDNLSSDVSFNDDKQFSEEVIAMDVPAENVKINDEIHEEVTPNKPIEIELKTADDNDDDFGDFDSFKCSNTEITNTQTHSILNTENPWENEKLETQDFGDFTANFDDNEQFPEVSEKCQTVSETKNNDVEDSAYCDDDFGDFDDFKSSDNKVDASPTSEDVLPCSNVFNFPTTDDEAQVMENINNVLATIFTEEIVEPDNSIEANLELVLGETWGHLIDTDVRQPYMVNWNSTLGQKSLLKALCIDSRNILFGTRWNYNMPKFATNLSTSPLQPQKQLAQPSTENNEQVSDKDANAWVDPFTPHGQESCSSENETRSADAKPKILDGFTSELPTSSNKIYSSTLSVQPIRQINLPDTHIFTPTDSETPRSKTIHYDSNPIALSTNFETEIIKSQTKPEPSEINTNSEKDNEYWDFQHFKGDSTISNATSSEEPISTGNDTSNHKSGMATQILQPIKLKPIIPTLNWPDPGEVKETFDDFSDFVSSVSNNTQDLKTQIFNSTTDVKIDQNIVEKIEETQGNIENDDDFETFQSAPLPSYSTDFKNIPQNSQTSTDKVANLSRIEQIDIVKSSEVSSNIEKVYKADAPNNQKSIPPQILTPFPSQITSLPVLQPSSVVRNQQNSGQILQPLSLEGYSQINWPNPGIDLHDLSKFNPIESVHSLKSETSASGQSKVSTPVHNSTSINKNDVPDDDIWGDFVSSAPKPQVASPKKTSTFVDDDEWTDFVSSPSIKPPNGLNTISFNVHTNLNLQKSSNQIKYPNKTNQISLDIPTLNYITPKTGSRGAYPEKHFQNL